MKQKIENNQEDQLIYKILTLKEFEEFQKNKVFMGSSLDKEDGFIHFSKKSQFLSVAKKFFAEETRIIVLEIDPYHLKGKLKWEVNKPTGEIYPHLYEGLITKDNVKGYQYIDIDEIG